MRIKEILNDLIRLRRHLHRYPELSGKEIRTASFIRDFMKRFYPDEEVRFGDTGLAFVYHGRNKGPTTLLRCDLDALPIPETGNFSYKSIYKGVSHKCGHDGHCAILIGLAGVLHVFPPEKGRVVFLFQPAEETGMGAMKIINDPGFKSIIPDFVFALHNIPGFDKGEIILRKGTFCSASRGMVIKLFGKTSQAAYPERGASPVFAMTEIIDELMKLNARKEDFDDFILLTIIHSRLGEIAFGTNPGYAEIMATLRSNRDKDMVELVKISEKLVKGISRKYGLRKKISWTETFDTTVNYQKAIEIIRKAAKNLKYEITTIHEPFRWSEDFGAFTRLFTGALFGLGAGKDHAELHHPDYDFPDDIIENGIMIFYAIIQSLNGLQS